MITPARITGSITRAQALDLIATIAAELAYLPEGGTLPVCAEYVEDWGGDDYAYLEIGNYGSTLAYGAITTPDLEAEAQAADDALAARRESSYLMGR